MVIEMNYRHMELWLFDTCNFRCGYCYAVEMGLVLDTTQLDFYRDHKNLDRLISFFNTHSDDNQKWLISFTGGEPFLTPNLSYLIGELISAGHKVCFNTNLSIPLNHKNYSWVNDNTAKSVEYIMCSFHPEWIPKQGEFFDRVRQLKQWDLKPIVRFVGHPAVLYLLEQLQTNCGEAGVTFFPTTLFSRNYPRAYADEEKTLLKSFMKGYSSLIQLEGGLDVSAKKCRAGSMLFAANITQGGDIRPCINTGGPIIGNILRNKLCKFPNEIACVKKDEVCTCDIHFQQGIVIGVSDVEEFALIKEGKGRVCASKWEEWKRENGIATTDKFFPGMGGVRDDSILVFNRNMIKAKLSRPRLTRCVGWFLSKANKLITKIF